MSTAATPRTQDLPGPGPSASPGGAGSGTTPGPAGPRQPGTALPPGKQPVGLPLVCLVAVVVALLVIAVGVVGVQHGLQAGGLVGPPSWLTRAAEGVDGLRAFAWTALVGLGLVLLGLWLVLTALRPRPRTSVALQARTGVYLRPRDVRRIAERAAGEVDGVTAVKVDATRSKVTARARTTGDPHVGPALENAIAASLKDLKQAPSVTVKTRGESL